MPKQILAALSRIENRLDAIEARQQEGPKVVNDLRTGLTTIANTFDESMRISDKHRWEMTESISELGDTLIRLGSPENIKVINKLVKSLPVLEETLTTLESLPQLLAIMTDSIDQYALKLNEAGFNLQDFNNNVAEILQQMISHIESGSINSLFKSGLLDKSSVEVVAAVGNSLATGVKKTRKISLFSLITALNNDDFKHALCFLMDFAQQFGKHIQEKQTRENL